MIFDQIERELMDGGVWPMKSMISDSCPVDNLDDWENETQHNYRLEVELMNPNLHFHCKPRRDFKLKARPASV